MAFTLVQNIAGSECIGTSRQKIVDNFTSLESTIIALSSQTINVTDTNTIDLTYLNATRNLQAAIKSNSIQESFMQSNSISTNKIIDAAITYNKLSTGSTSDSVTPRVAKAWVNFNGATNPPTINASYNVSNVVKNSTGDYTITFTQNLGTSNYSVCGTSRHQTTNTSNTGFGSVISVHPTEAPTSTTLRIWNTSFQRTNVVSNVVTEADSSFVSVQIFA